MFNKFKNIINSIGINHFDQSIDDCEKEYLRPEVKVGLWGHYSSGKSSFINALLGEDLLPVKIIETTAIVTELRYSKQRSFDVYTENEKKSYPYSKELAEIILTRKVDFDDINPSTKKELESRKFEELVSQLRIDNIVVDGENPLEGLIKVVIFSDNEILNKGLVFLDLPGLQGADTHAYIATKEIRDCGMVIYFKQSNEVIHKYDVEVLERLTDVNSSRVLVGVLNKLDLALKENINDYKCDKTLLKSRNYLISEFEKELSNHVEMSLVIGLSPLILKYLKQEHGDQEAALLSLKNKYKKNYRSLTSEHNLAIFAGQDCLEQLINQFDILKDKAKAAVLVNKLTPLFMLISDEIYKKTILIDNAKETSKSEYEDKVRKLDHIKDAVLNMNDFKGEVKEDISTLTKKLAMDSLSFSSVKVVDEIINVKITTREKLNEVIRKGLEKWVLDYISSDGRDDVKKIFAIGIDRYSKYISNISSMLNEVNNIDKFIFKQNIHLDDLSIGDVKSSSWNFVDSSSCAVAADGAFVLAEHLLGDLFGGFGMFTAFRLAMAGYEEAKKSSDPLAGFLGGVGKGFANIAKSIFGLFRSFVEDDTAKERREMEEFQLSLKRDSSVRSKFVIDIENKSVETIKDSLDRFIINQLHEQLEISKQKDDFLESYKTEVELANFSFNDCKEDVKNKTKQKMELEQALADIQNVLIENGIIDSKKVAA